LKSEENIMINFLEKYVQYAVDISEKLFSIATTDLLHFPVSRVFLGAQFQRNASS